MSDDLEVKEMFNSPGWKIYVDDCEETMVALFRQMFFLDPGKAESFIQFVALKSRIDQLRDSTYTYEYTMTENRDDVEQTYTKRFIGLLRRIWRN